MFRLHALGESEKTVERRLVSGIKNLGGLCLKFVSPGNVGVPDRLIITASGRVLFVELKAPAGRLSKMQQYMISKLRRCGAEVHVLYGTSAVEDFLTMLEQKEKRAKGGGTNEV